MKMRSMILLAILGAVVAVPMPARQQRIVGGEPTTIETHPYMSNMEIETGGITWSTFCGGSLITSIAVLSAAHCFEGTTPSQWRVRLGSSYMSSGGFLNYVTRIKVHEDYDGSIPFSRDNDLAIIRLTTPAMFSASVGVALIAGRSYNPPAGTPVTSIGWGYLSDEDERPEQLREVETYLIDRAICADRYAALKSNSGYEYIPNVTNGMICAGNLDVSDKDTCQGDAGGPLIHQGNVIVGVTSWGPWSFECGHPSYPGVNAHVSYYSDWIVANGST